MAFDRSPIETEIIAVAQPTGNRPDKGRPYLRKNWAGNRRQNKPFVGPRGQQFPSSSTRFQEQSARWACRRVLRLSPTRAFDPGWGNGWPLGSDDSPVRASQPQTAHPTGQVARSVCGSGRNNRR